MENIFRIRNAAHLTELVYRAVLSEGENIGPLAHIDAAASQLHPTYDPCVGNITFRLDDGREYSVYIRLTI